MLMLMLCADSMGRIIVRSLLLCAYAYACILMSSEKKSFILFSQIIISFLFFFSAGLVTMLQMFVVLISNLSKPHCSQVLSDSPTFLSFRFVFPSFIFYTCIFPLPRSFITNSYKSGQINVFYPYFSKGL